MWGILPKSTLTREKKARKQSQINIQETSNSLQTKITKERLKHMRVLCYHILDKLIRSDKI